MDENPNTHEKNMNVLIEEWDALRPLLDLVVSNVKRGKPPTFEQMQSISTLSRDINVKISALKISALIPYQKTPEQPAPPKEVHVSWHQREINEFLAAFVEEEKLNPSILEGEKQREVRFSFHFSERVYQRDFFHANVPQELWELRRHELVDFLKEKIQNNPWDYFTDMETDDSEVLDDTLEIC